MSSELALHCGHALRRPDLVAALVDRATDNPVGRQILAVVYNLDHRYTESGYPERLTELARRRNWPVDTVHSVAASLIAGPMAAELRRPLPRAEVARLEPFLAGELHFAISREGGVVTRATRDLGECLCAFTTPALLAEYQRAVNAPASDTPVARTARQVIDLLARVGGIGLAVDPLSGGGFWPAAQVATV